jgi:rhodanese-related sulfurtransferase
VRLPSLWWLPFGKVPEISPETLHQWLESGRPLQIVDARTTLEFEQGTIGDARHAPLIKMPGSMEQLNLNGDGPVVVLCLSGHRSRPGTRWLRARGLEAYSLQGGVNAWKKSGFSLQTPGEEHDLNSD